MTKSEKNSLILSLVLHGVFFAVLGVFAKQLTLELEQIVAQNEITIEDVIMAEKLADAPVESETIAVAKAKPLEKAPVSKKASVKNVSKEEKISKDMAKLVAQMKKFAVSGVTKVEKSDSKALNEKTNVDEMKKRLSNLANVDLSKNFKVVGQGHTKMAQWDVYAKKDESYSARDLDDVANVFRSLQENFRTCYENALLKFEDLSVTVHYEAEVASGGHLSPGRFQTTGISSPESERVLHSCLDKVLRNAKLSAKLQGAKVRNQFIFRS